MARNQLYWLSGHRRQCNGVAWTDGKQGADADVAGNSVIPDSWTISFSICRRRALVIFS